MEVERKIPLVAALLALYAITEVCQLNFFRVFSLSFSREAHDFGRLCKPSSAEKARNILESLVFFFLKSS